MKALFAAGILTTTMFLSGVQAESVNKEGASGKPVAQKQSLRDAQIQAVEDIAVTQVKSKEEKQAVHSVADLARKASKAEEAKKEGRELSDEEQKELTKAKLQAAEDIAKTQTDNKEEQKAFGSFFNLLKVASDTDNEE